MNPATGEEDFNVLKEQMAQMKREGRHEDALLLQANIKQQVRRKDLLEIKLFLIHILCIDIFYNTD